MTSQPTRTRRDLIDNALSKLGVSISNQVADLEDILYVDVEIESIFRKLEGIDLVYVPDRGSPGPMGGSIPGALFDDIGSIVADLVSPKFGLSPDDSQKLNQRGLGTPPGTGTAAMSLHKILRGRPTYETLRTDYF